MTRYEKWLKERKNGIGGSDAAAVLGLSPFKSNIQLWEEKTGRRDEDTKIAENPRVKYGKEAEAPLRVLFGLDFPEYEILYDEYFIHRNEKYPFISATLDGVLVEKDTGKKGIIEIKTATISSAAQRAAWSDGSIPEQYFIQILHQLLATGFDFVVLKAQLKYMVGDTQKTDTRHYRVERPEVEKDLPILLNAEVEFWTKYVEKDIKPPAKLVI